MYREDLVALAYLLGSDYTEGIHGVGIVNAVEIVQAFSILSTDITATTTSSDVTTCSIENNSTSSNSGGIDINNKDISFRNVSDNKDKHNRPIKVLQRFKEWLHGFDFASELFSAAAVTTTSIDTTVLEQNSGALEQERKLVS